MLMQTRLSSDKKIILFSFPLKNHCILIKVIQEDIKCVSSLGAETEIQVKLGE